MIFYLQVNSAYLLISTWLRKVEHAPCYILMEHHFTAANSEAALAILVSLKPFTVLLKRFNSLSEMKSEITIPGISLHVLF